MRLLQLSLINFQGIRSLDLDFNGRSASILGDNATGKTTVFNAITWLLFDKASTGAKNFTPKTKGADGDLHYLDHSAEATFQTDHGRLITFKKTYKEVYKKKRGSAREEFSGHTVDYWIDGVPTKEKDYTAEITAFCGGDTEKPKMLTIPDYFPEQIPWNVRRQILLDICGDISDEDVIARTPELKELPDFLRMSGTEDRYYSIDDYRKRTTARMTEINQQISSIPSRIDEAQRAIPDTTGLDEASINRMIKALEEKVEKLRDDKAAVANIGTASDLKRQIDEFRLKIIEGRAAHKEAYQDATASIDADIHLARRRVTDATHQIEDYDREIGRKVAEKERLDNLRGSLLSDYQHIHSERWDEAQETCPTCGQSLPAERIEKLKAQFNERKSQRLEDITARISREASEEASAALAAEIESLKAKRTAAGEEKIAAENELEALKKSLPEQVPYESTEEYAALNAQIAAVQEKLTDEGRSRDEEISRLDREIRQVNDAIREERDKLMQLTMEENQHRRIGELEKQEKKLNAEYEEAEKGLYLCGLFIKAKVAALTDRINGQFKSVNFRLFQEQLNGGVKEDCEVMIPTADGKMVPYTFANNAARINAGLEIIQTLSSHWGVQMPVFIDNAESITHLAQSDTQVIRLVVSEADKKLRLEVDE